MPTLAGFFEVKYGAARNHFAAVAQEAIHQLQQIYRAWLPIHQGHHIHAKGILQLRHFVQIVQNDFGDFAALKLNHHAHARFIGFIAQIRNTFNFLFVHQLGDTFNQALFIHLIRDFVHDNRLAISAFWNGFKVRFRTHHHAATPRAIAFAHTCQTVNRRACREIRSRHEFH